jgi:CheY-like chemotaxis protein
LNALVVRSSWCQIPQCGEVPNLRYSGQSPSPKSDYLSAVSPKPVTSYNVSRRCRVPQSGGMRVAHVRPKSGRKHKVREHTMPNRGPKTGSGHLTRKSELAIARAGKPAFEDILVVEDNLKEATRLSGTLNLIFNRKAAIRTVDTLAKALDAVIAQKPDIVFLDDHLKPNDNAAETIPFLRRCGYQGPIVVVSSLLTRPRRALLISAGAIDAVHKDNLDGVEIEECLAKAYAKLAADPPEAT